MAQRFSVAEKHLPELPSGAEVYADDKYIVIRYNTAMVPAKRKQASAIRVSALAEFRYRLRLFLRFSEMAAHKVGIPPQQHQLLLQIAGAPDPSLATIGFAAKRLGLRHNTVVELSTRCQKAGWLVRKQTGSDRRRVLLEVTRQGRATLEALSIDHARELDELVPQLIRTLTTLQTLDRKSSPCKIKMKMTMKTKDSEARREI